MQTLRVPGSTVVPDKSEHTLPALQTSQLIRNPLPTPVLRAPR
jgi:hypothetical protein